jgi:hypothetical protein
MTEENLTADETMILADILNVIVVLIIQVIILVIVLWPHLIDLLQDMMSLLAHTHDMMIELVLHLPTEVQISI